MAEIYREGQRPDDAEVAERRERYWRPYHDKVAAALGAIKARHGFALLWDAHSIRSVLPRFFEGRLPELNLGTGDGSAAAPGLLDLLPAVATDAERSEEHTSELQSLMRLSYAVFCLKKKNT